MRVLTLLVGLASMRLLAAPDTAPPASCAARKAGAAPEAFVAIAPARGRDTLMRASVCVVLPAGSRTMIGSYHGELHFDSSAVAAVRVQRIEGGMRVENTTIPGRVNFAGAAPAGFPQGTVVTVVMRLRKAGVQPPVELRMLELNATDGTNLLTHLVGGAR
jgi:hypothetical protein